METRLRSVTKAGLWTALGLMAGAIVGFLFTGSFLVGGTMAAINSFIGLVTYVVYERVCDRITWGRLDV